MYLLGLEPKEQSQTLVGKVQRVRDACIVFSSERCYREHPLSWVTRHLPRAGLDLVRTFTFSLLHCQADLMEQVKNGAVDGPSSA